MAGALLHVCGYGGAVVVSASGLGLSCGWVGVAEAPGDEVPDGGAGGGVDLGDAGFGDAEFVGAALSGPAVAVRSLHDAPLLAGEVADRGTACA